MRPSSPRKLFLVSLLAWVISLVVGIVHAAPLLHDEAAYAVLARTDAEQWLYRPRGMVWLSEIGVWLGGDERTMRLAPALLAVALLGSIYLLGRRTFDAATAAWTAAVVACSLPIMQRAPLLLPDTASAAMLVLALVVIAGELGDRTPTYRIALAAPLLAAAFYLRYGSAPVIAIVVVATLVAFRRQLRLGPTLAMLGLLGALLVPFAVLSLRDTGSILGVLEQGRSAGRGDYLGHGLVVMVTSNPFVYFGAIAAPCVLAGVVAIAWPAQRRLTWYLAAIAIGAIVSIGLVSNGSPRYFLFPTLLLVMLGVDLIRRAVPPRPRAALVLVALAWAGGIVGLVTIQRGQCPTLMRMVNAARTIRTHAAGKPCIVIAPRVPQLMWYSGCDGVRDDMLSLLGPAHWYLVDREPDFVTEALGVRAIRLRPGTWYLAH